MDLARISRWSLRRPVIGPVLAGSLVLASAAPARAHPIPRLRAHLSRVAPAAPAGTPVVIALHVSLPAGRHLVSYRLGFGDGSAQSGSRLPLTVRHVFPVSGNQAVATIRYLATLHVVDSAGRATTTALWVPVLEPLTSDRAAALAVTWWQGAGPAILGRLRNGQCTDWASRMRPDIVERAAELQHQQLLLGQAPATLRWVARDWAETASAAGFPVGPIPQVGAIAVFQPGVDGANATTGHVAYVEAVNADGSYRVSEENVGGPYRMASRTLPGPQDGVSFIGH
jgi:hypothetical protein